MSYSEAFRTFDLDDTYIRTLSSGTVPEDVAERVLSALNSMDSPESLLESVFELGEGETGIERARGILAARDSSGGFSTIEQLYELDFLDEPRFTDLTIALGVLIDPYTPDLSQSDVQPATPRFSASATEQEFRYRILLDGPLNGLEGSARAARCSSCRSFAPALNREMGIWEAGIEVTSVIMDGENEHGKFSIAMDMALQPFDYMHSLDRTAPQFQFPAKMHLNNNMIISFQPTGLDTIMRLVSREIPSQVGRITHWPPYGMRLYTQRPVIYFNADDPLGNPVMEVLEGTTYLLGPSAFLGHRADILEYEYLSSENRGAVRLVWRPFPERPRFGEVGSHYYVYRSTNPNSEDSWSRVSGRVKTAEWIDPSPPLSGSIYYRVTPVWVTIFGEDFEGFPGQVQRIEPQSSSFRR